MNHQRNILIAALLRDYLLMVLQWNADYGAAKICLPAVAEIQPERTMLIFPVLPDGQGVAEAARTDDVPPGK